MAGAGGDPGVEGGEVGAPGGGVGAAVEERLVEVEEGVDVEGGAVEAFVDGEFALGVGVGGGWRGAGAVLGGEALEGVGLGAGGGGGGLVFGRVDLEGADGEGGGVEGGGEDPVVFGEGEFMLFNRLFLTLGARGNFNSIFGANLSPRAYLAYNAIDNWLTIKGGVSTGYKSPSLNNLVAEIVSFSGSGSNPTYGNPNLRPESSVNYELSLISDNDFFNVSLTGFYINFKDKINQVGGLGGSITNGQLIPAIGVTCYATSGACSYYDNEDTAISYGAEVFLGIKPINVGYGSISLNAAYTYNKTEIIQGSDIGAQFTNVPLHSLNASLNYDTHRFGAYIRQEYKAGIYRGDPSVANSAAAAAGEYYDPYHLTHLGGHIKFSNALRLNLAIYNLFDFNFIDYTQYNNGSNWTNAFNYVREGRRYYASIVFDF